MKTVNIFKVLLLAVITLSLSSCVEDKDYTIPNVNEVASPNLSANFTIKKAQEAVAANNSMVSFDDISGGSELILEGYVISSDEAGNFYKQIYIQDAAENATAGIRVSIDETDLYTFYEVGRKVYIKLSGLGVALANGVYEIGKINGTSLERIPSTEYKNHIVRDNKVETIVPRVITVGQITDSKIGTLVMFENMQAESKDQTYANLDNTFSVNRTFISCENDETIVMRNSGFADFKGQAIPNKRGSITAVLSRYNSTDQIFIRSTDDVAFNESRCDALFEDNFSAENFDKWIVQNVTGDQEWEVVSFGNPAPSAKISGFSSGPKANEDWLISKAIDLAGFTSATFTFDNVKRYGGPDIEVYYSTNYNEGNPNDAVNTWTQLSPTLDTNTGSWSSWTPSGDLDVSAAAGGKLYVAFKYVSTTGGAATFEIDNVKVKAQ